VLLLPILLNIGLTLKVTENTVEVIIFPWLCWAANFINFRFWFQKTLIKYLVFYFVNCPIKRARLMGLILDQYKHEEDDKLLKGKAKEMLPQEESNNPQTFFVKMYGDITGGESPDDDLASLKRTQSSITRQRKLDIETLNVTPDFKKEKKEVPKKKELVASEGVTEKIAYRITKISMPIWLILTIFLSALVVFLPAMITNPYCDYKNFSSWQIAVQILSMVSSMISFSALLASITIMAVRFQRGANFIYNPQFSNFLRSVKSTDEVSAEIIYEQLNAWYKVYDNLLQKAKVLMKESQEFLVLFTILTIALDVFFFIYIYSLSPSSFLYSFIVLVIILNISFIFISYLLGKLTGAIEDQEGDLIRFQLKVRNNVSYDPVRDLEIKNTFDLLLSYIKTLDNGCFVFSFKIEPDFYIKAASLFLSAIPGVFPALVPLFVSPNFTHQCFIDA